VSSKTVAFVLYPGLTPLDLIGPLQVMSGLEAVEEALGSPDRHHVVVVAERLDAFPTDTPVRIAASNTLDDIPAPDVIFVPGGGAPTLRQLANPVLLNYVREADRTAEVVASVCTGSLLLAGAGLLQGRPATTHWAYRGFLDRLGARYVAERWVEDGRYLTGAGVSAGIDTALLPSVGSTGPRLTATCFGRESKASHMRRSAITQTCSPAFSASGAQMPGRGGSRQ
jgi:putative intracellular protease/amidase